MYPSLYPLFRKRNISLLALIASIVLVGCSPLRKSANPWDKVQADPIADSILAYALDHEALYSLADTIKPISSVKLMRYAVAKDSLAKPGQHAVVKNMSRLDSIERYQRLAKMLSGGDWLFVIAPFEWVDKGYRNMEMYVIRRSRFGSVVRENASFFGQWGFTSSTDPAVVLNTIEYESKYDRYRGYGYLFGYPRHAVDFFVEASIVSDMDTAHKLVPRNFFAIPVHASETGHFTYAIPKDYKTGPVDSSIYYKAIETLKRYRNLRSHYTTATGLRARELWRKLNEQ